jgi:hypothetical protein
MDGPSRVSAQRPAGAETTPAARLLQRECDCGGGAHGECDECRRRRLDRAASGPAPDLAPPLVHDVLSRSGSRLEPPLRAEMEGRLGHDLSRVRVHTGPLADASARAVGAAAYTVGSDVVFGGARYQPHTAAGRGLLAHELAHTVQQSAAASPGPIAVAPADHPLERNARAAAAGRERPHAAAQPILQRQPTGQLPPPDFRLPDVSLFPRRQPRYLIGSELRFGPHLLPEDRSRIVAFLREGGFSVGTGYVPWFALRPTTLDDVIESARRLVLPIIPREEVAAVVNGMWLSLTLRALTTDPPPLPPPFIVPLRDVAIPPPAPEVPEQLQSAIGGQWTWHMDRRGPVERSVQVQLQQGEGALQRIYQFAVNLDTGDVQVMGGVQLQQETPEAHVLGAVLKASVFLQLLGGVTTAAGSASGSMTLQVQAGVQLTVTIGPVQAAVQLAPTWTLQAGQPLATDFNIAPQVGADQLARGNYPPFLGIPILRGTF